MTTPKLSLEEIAQSQASKYVTHNNALRDLDVLVQGAAESIGGSTPPGSPSDGDTYIVAQGSPSATGDWAGYEGYVAFYKSSAWRFLSPSEGWAFYIKDEDKVYRYDGSTWAEETSGTSLTITSDDSPSVDGTYSTMHFTGSAVNVSGSGSGTVTVDVQSTSGVDVTSDDSPSVSGSFTELNFTGDGVNVTDAGSGVANIDIASGGGGSGVTVTSDDSPTVDDSFTTLHFIGDAINITDSGGGTATVEVQSTSGVDVTASGDSPAVTGSFTELEFTGNNVDVEDAGSGVARINIYPNFRGASIARSTGQTISNNTNVQVDMDTIEFDTDGMADLGSPDTRLIVQTAGYYQVMGTFTFAAAASGVRQWRIHINGTLYNYVDELGDSALAPSRATTFIAQLDAGDEIELVAYQTSGSDLNISVFGESKPRLQAVLIGE